MRHPNNNLIPHFYRKLFKHYGPQGWWPVTPSHGERPLYKLKKSLTRNSESEKFEICLGAILTQNTNWENVVKALGELKRHDALNVKAILSLPSKRLEKLIRSSGYFRQKANRTKIFFRSVFKKNKKLGDFLGGTAREGRKKLLAISGIGPETADSMLLYAQGHPAFVVDAYTRRIGERWGILKGGESYEEVQKIFTRALPASVDLFGEYHALLVRLGKEVCRKKPLCERCCLKVRCPGRKRFS